MTSSRPPPGKIQLKISRKMFIFKIAFADVLLKIKLFLPVFSAVMRFLLRCFMQTCPYATFTDSFSHICRQFYQMTKMKQWNLAGIINSSMWDFFTPN